MFKIELNRNMTFSITEISIRDMLEIFNSGYKLKDTIYFKNNLSMLEVC